MLLVPASKDISEPSQAYKMGVLAKTVIVLKFILKAYMMNIKGLFVWTLGSVIRVIQLIWTWRLKKPFVSYLLITWIMAYWIQGNNRIPKITRITWITRFLFISCFDQFCIYIPKSNVNGIPRIHKWQKSETYIHNQTYKRLVQMAALISYSMAWSVGSPRFICLCINFSHYLDQRINDPFFQTNSS